MRLQVDNCKVFNWRPENHSNVNQFTAAIFYKIVFNYCYKKFIILSQVMKTYRNTE